MRFHALAALAATTGFLSVPAAFAQDDVPANIQQDLAGDRVTVGVGVATLPTYEGSDKNATTPLGLIVGKVSGINFWTRGTALYVDLVPDNEFGGTHIEAGPIVAARFERNKVGDDPDKDLRNSQVSALGKIDTAYELGGFVGIEKTGIITSDYDRVSARISYQHDVSGSHESYIISPQISYMTPLSRYNLVSLGVSADYVGKGYGRTYFGVTPAGSEASGLPIYNVDSAGFKRINLSLIGLQSITGDLSHGLGIGGGIIYGKLLGKYKDSPIVRDVGDSDQWIAAVGLSYTF